ncbi:amino acid transporter [Xylariomycetidae sp. FL0641]|nr:amino acid transporter [Xylariomycetidae sp. FL0641]
MALSNKTPSNHEGQRQPELGGLDNETVAAIDRGIEVNAAGYKDQLKRQYGLFGIVGIALTVDNAWAALGSSISVSILSGGPPGLIYGLIVALFYYSFIGLSLAELASSVPTAGGVYHWATIAGGPRWGRMLGFFTGWINFYGWMFDLAALVQISSNILVQMYVTYHQDGNSSYTPAAWHVYVTYVAVLWLATAFVVLANRLVPYTQNLGMFFVVAGGVVTIAVLAAMPEQHATNDFVWAAFDENNLTGWPGGVAFLLGVLNGAFTVGTPDAVTHIAEELPRPRRDLPRAIGLQIALGGLYAFVFAVALSYAITDLSALQQPPAGGIDTYPLAAIYRQATRGSRGATLALLLVLFLSTACCCVGTVLTNSRAYWALARDEAVPWAGACARVDARRSCPVPATLFVGAVATALGAVALVSDSAFLALTGSFIVLTTVSYALPLAANLAGGRRYFPPGPFHLGRAGFAVNALAVAFIVLFDVLFMFPYALPTDAQSMNYNSVILVGVLALSGIWWCVHGTKKYPGPRVMQLYIHDEDPGAVVATSEVLEAKVRKEDLPRDDCVGGRSP